MFSYLFSGIKKKLYEVGFSPMVSEGIAKREPLKTKITSGQQTRLNSVGEKEGVALKALCDLLAASMGQAIAHASYVAN